MAKKDNLEKLLVRLRELEAETLRLAEKDVASSKIKERDIYEERIERLDKSHSRSWLGDHSSTYYGDFQAPPGGRTFDVEWGFVPGFHGSNNPGWRTYSRDDIKAFVFANIGEDIFQVMHDLAEEVVEQFSIVRDQSLDVIEALSSKVSSKAIARYRDTLENKIKPYTVTDYLNSCIKSAPNMTRDSEEIAKGRIVPAHIQYWGPFQSIDVNRQRLRELASTLRKTIEAVNLSNEIDIPMTIKNDLPWSWWLGTMACTQGFLEGKTWPSL